MGLSASLLQSFINDGFRGDDETTLSGHRALVARRAEFRWRWFATRLHVFVFIMDLPTVNVSMADELASVTRGYAVLKKGGFPRGFQTGSASVPILIVPEADEEMVEWVDNRHEVRFGAFVYPVIVDRKAGRAIYRQKRSVWGFAYTSYIRDIIERDVVQTVMGTELWDS